MKAEGGRMKENESLRARALSSLPPSAFILALLKTMIGARLGFALQ
jgi:hypothetical protein